MKLRTPEVRTKARVPRDPRAMIAGNTGRLTADGPVYVVDRVSTGAAYVHRVYDPPLVREIGRDALDVAVTALLAAIDSGTPDEARRAAAKAHAAAEGYRRIEVSRGPAEPGISTASRFIAE